MDTSLRLLERLADGRFHSGTALAAALGVSRTAVWKAVHRLAADGVTVDAVHGRGYRLPRPLELLDEAALRAELGPRARALLARLEVHRRLASTSSHLLACAQAGDPAGVACVADAQHGGRGRHGRRWQSPFGAGVYLSLLWRYPEGPEVLAGLSLAVGVALAERLRDLGARGIGLKWPNDLVCAAGKVGGILVESAGEAGGPAQVVVGVGLNVALPAAVRATIDQPSADLADCCDGPPPGRNRVAGQALDALLELLAGFSAERLAASVARWAEFDVLAGRSVQVTLGDRVYRGRSRGIAADGALLLESGGALRRFHGGEASLREHA